MTLTQRYLDLMGLIARSRISSIVNSSVSYLTFLKKKKKSKKNKKTSSSSKSPNFISPTKLPDSAHSNKNVKKIVPKKEINLQKQLSAKETRFVDQKYNPPHPRKMPDSSTLKINNDVKAIIPKKDVVDLEFPFTKERFVDEKDCFWLTTDRPSTTTTAYFDQCRSSLSHFMFDERLNVWLSRSSISKVTEWLSRPSATKAADWLTRASLSKEDESFILGRDLPSEEAEILMLTSSASNVSKTTTVEDLDQNGLNMMISLVNLDDPHRSSIAGTALLEGSDGEPLFWPFELKFETDGDEKVGYFSMSPRRDIVAKVDSSGRVEFPRISRVSTSSNTSCAKLVALSLEGGSIPIEKIMSFKRDWLGSEDISFSDQLPVENLLGLGEFDGHEGLGDEDTFSLDGSFLKN